MTSNAARRWQDEDDDTVYLHGLTWDDYERLLEMRGDRSAPRITYLDGEVQITSPSRGHESIKSTIGCLVETWCLVHQLPFQAVGSWTLKEAIEKAGVEPDECYIFGDLARERPDLAFEIVWKGRGVHIKEAVYHRLGIRELWVWDKGALQVRARGARGYRNVKASAVLPSLDVAQLASFLDRDTTYAAMRDYRAALGG